MFANPSCFQWFGFSRHETVFQQTFIIEQFQIYVANSLQRILRGACRRRRREMLISHTHEYFAIVYVKKNKLLSQSKLGRSRSSPGDIASYVKGGREGVGGSPWFVRFEKTWLLLLLLSLFHIDIYSHSALSPADGPPIRVDPPF